MPVGLSVFRRGNYIWVIFDHPQNLDIESLREAAAPVADEVLQIPHPGAAILRILPKTKLNASVRKEGLLWIVDLFTRDAPEETKGSSRFIPNTTSAISLTCLSLPRQPEKLFRLLTRKSET